MVSNSRIQYGYINVIEPSEHKGELTRDKVERFTEGFRKPALLRKLAPIGEEFSQRAFFDQVGSGKNLQWRVKSGDQPVSMRDENGASDYNYVTGRVGTGQEFLDDIFTHHLDVYSHLGTISSSYNDPYEWGKDAFNLVKQHVFSKPWFNIDAWKVTGHMFLGYSTQEYGEPARGAVGSDWHIFPTLNIFVMIAGTKKWSTRPPQLGDQFRDYDLMFETSSGREAPGGDYEADTVYVEPGDVLINPPFEWHKVLNARGLSIGAAFRVIDIDYLGKLENRRNLDLSKVAHDNGHFAETEELAHFLTSVNYASRHINRAQMLLNDIEYAYLRKRGNAGSVKIGHR
ncbi:hypothetical protein F2A38_16905 [Pseudomonas chlororaphis]|uniref:JmjC domain-containing protein n=1 Tax=Pseudomonas chlororaphis TaxID=587753 RepID=A0AB34C3A8_9PSED|nr:hypothetical protein [Pseudomonas chlororaphis]KAA5841164.1 hypothetical protein F2A38_16905 [Pseudomonas chlororaphis]